MHVNRLNSLISIFFWHIVLLKTLIQLYLHIQKGMTYMYRTLSYVFWACACFIWASLMSNPMILSNLCTNSLIICPCPQPISITRGSVFCQKNHNYIQIQFINIRKYRQILTINGQCHHFKHLKQMWYFISHDNSQAANKSLWWACGDSVVYLNFIFTGWLAVNCNTNMDHSYLVCSTIW